MSTAMVGMAACMKIQIRLSWSRSLGVLEAGFWSIFHWHLSDLSAALPAALKSLRRCIALMHVTILISGLILLLKLSKRCHVPCPA